MCLKCCFCVYLANLVRRWPTEISQSWQGYLGLWKCKVCLKKLVERLVRSPCRLCNAKPNPYPFVLLFSLPW
jgi:hypothetical protein